ncbi:MAG: hypothetical protein HKN19_04755 [Halioglobus sp.]|nr:hypothetical protein [Halioglobus sp.]
MLRLLLTLTLLCASTYAQAEPRVLYVTHEPGRWHDYTAQLNTFRDIAADANWELTVASGDVDALLAFLKQPNYADDHDAVVYNFCLANSRDIAAMENLIAQTEVNGVPALLLHCAMHSWWGTFKKGKKIPGNAGEARANRKLLKQWQKGNADRPLPAWGDFTGVASTKHGPQQPIALTATGEHPATKNLPADYHTEKTELYNNHYVTEGVEPLLYGKQGNTEAIVMWTVARGSGRIVGLTLGHAKPEWSDAVFLQLLTDSVNWLAGH